MRPLDRENVMSIRFALTITAVAALAVLPLLPAAGVFAAPPQVPGVRLIEAWPDREFPEPVDIAHHGTERMYVVSQPGRIRAVMKWRGVGQADRPKMFLDIKSRVAAIQQGGLLSLAFHPRFDQNRKFYVCYLAKHADPQLKFKLVVSEFTATGGSVDACVGDPNTERKLLEMPKRLPVHQGGDLEFGPRGKLFVSTGDGGIEKEGKSQDIRGWFGKILRIDVDARSAGKAYGIPSDNPWPNIPNQVLPELYAYGFRNPWRMSFDAQGRLWTTEPGTKGPDSREWVMLVQRAGNHGWPYYEGKRRLRNPPASVKLVPPVFEYVRGAGTGGTAGIGGFVYRGSRVPSLRGKYVFGDYMRGEVYCIDLAGAGQGVTGRNWRKIGDVDTLSSIGEDAQGELYFCSNDGGFIFMMAPE